MDQISKILKSDVSKSEKMRLLNKAGVSRWNISKLMDVKYQFVRNVLEREISKNSKG